MDSKVPILRVVLNGVFLIVDDYNSDKIKILLPNIGAEHSYLAGNFMAEVPLEQGLTYELVGVGKGDCHFDPTENVIVSGGTSLIEANGARGRNFATLILPQPDKISGKCETFSQVTADTFCNFFCQASTPASKPIILSTPASDNNHHWTVCHVLDYYHLESDLTAVQLRNHSWTPIEQKLETDKCCQSFPSLFIYSDAPEVAPDNHRIKAFNAAMGLLEPAPLQMIKDLMHHSENVAAAERIMNLVSSRRPPQPDIRDCESQGLKERSSALTYFGQSLRFQKKAGQGLNCKPTFSATGHPPGCSPGAILEMNKPKKNN